MLGEEISCRELEPVLRDTWVGQHAAWPVLLNTQSLMKAALRRLRSDNPQLSWSHWEDVTQEIFAGILTRATHHKGLTRPPSCESRSPTAWMIMVYRNMGRDVLKKIHRQGSREVAFADPGAEESTGPRLEHVAGAATVDEGSLDVLRRQQLRLRSLELAPLKPQQKLAWVVLKHPHLLTQELVAAACTYGKGGSVMRSGDETWALLQEWSQLHEANPDTSESRRRLGWILRSGPEVSWDMWENGSPSEERRARDTLRKWCSRAEKAIAAFEAGESSCP